jgi:hypothetical protein
MKQHLGGDRFGKANKVEISTKRRLKVQGTVFSRQWIGKLIPRHDKCLSFHGDNVLVCESYSDVARPRFNESLQDASFVNLLSDHPSYQRITV